MTNLFALFLIILYTYTILSTISVLLLENRNPVKSISWVLVLLFLPLLGMILYLYFGQDYRKKKIISKKSIRKVIDRPFIPIENNNIDWSIFTSNQLNLIKLLNRNSDAPGYCNNKIDVFSSGNESFESLFDEIKKAKDHIHLQFFIFDDDRISNQLRELLISKTKEGIRVRMIFDYWGSFKLSKKYIQSLRDAGIYARAFLPFRWKISRSSKINYRNHRKLVVIDGEIGFIGGLNVADRYIYGNKLGNWRDTFVRMEGAAVHGLQLLFMIDWYFVDRKFIDGPEYFPKPKIFGPNMVQLVSSGPDTDWESIMQGIASAIISATKYVYIHTPYFMPTDVISNCIEIAVLSGIDVRLMIPVKSDSLLSTASTRTYLGKVLEAGGKVYLYEKGFLHSKAIVIDDFISIVGSANFDERSFNQNFEANAFIYDAPTAHKLKQLYLQDIEHCVELNLNDWNNRKRSQKLKESFARLFSPLM